MPDCLIIGAGVAGTAAAEYLAASGITPRLIDKAARPGGRCATGCIDKNAEAGWFDYGAQYFTARDDDFCAVAEADRVAGRLANWRPSIAVAEQTAGSWLLSPSPDDRERLIGPAGLNRWVREHLASADLSVDCSRRAESVRVADDGWRITFDDGRLETARAVLLTTPAAQTAALLGDRAVSIDVLADADTALAACHSVVVEASAMPNVDAIFFKSGRLSWAADNTHKAGRERDRHLWTLHANSQYSEQTVETPTVDLAADLIAQFAAATGQPAADMRIVQAHRWRYARPGSGAPAQGRSCWVDPHLHLALAGDWLAGGRVEGAWLSGRAAARQLVGCAG